jgi:hypothetical protein
MLSDWLAPVPVTDFLHEHLHRQAFAAAGTAAAAGPLLDWETVGRVLSRAPAGDVLPVLRGRTVEAEPPRDLPALRVAMARQVGVVIRRGERYDAGLGGLAQAFARDLPGEVHLQLFVTAAGTHGFGWHYDFEDVFIVQTAGVKDYYFRHNTVDPDTPRDAQPDFENVRRETSPIQTARLQPGDWLYIPARWWHVALCHQDSLSISVGVFPAATPPG